MTPVVDHKHDGVKYEWRRGNDVTPWTHREWFINLGAGTFTVLGVAVIILSLYFAFLIAAQPSVLIGK